MKSLLCRSASKPRADTQCGPAKARPFRLGTVLRTSSITAAKPSSSMRRSHIVTSARSFAVEPNNAGSGRVSKRYRMMAGTSPSPALRRGRHDTIPPDGYAWRIGDTKRRKITMEDDDRLVRLEANVAGLSSLFIDLAAIIHDMQPKAIEELLGKRRALVQQLE